MRRWSSGFYWPQCRPPGKGNHHEASSSQQSCGPLLQKTLFSRDMAAPLCSITPWVCPTPGGLERHHRVPIKPLWVVGKPRLSETQTLVHTFLWVVKTYMSTVCTPCSKMTKAKYCWHNISVIIHHLLFVRYLILAHQPSDRYNKAICRFSTCLSCHLNWLRFAV